MPTSDHPVHKQALGFDRFELIALAESTVNQMRFVSDPLAVAGGGASRHHGVASRIATLAERLVEFEERSDHCTPTEEMRSTLVDEVIPDLLTYAVYLAALTGSSLDDALYRRRACSEAGLVEDSVHATYCTDEAVLYADQPLCVGEAEVDRVSLLATHVVSAVTDASTIDTDLRSYLDAESLRLGFNSRVAHAVSNYTVSVRKLRRFAATCASIQDVEREIRGVVSRELERD